MFTCLHNPQRFTYFLVANDAATLEVGSNQDSGQLLQTDRSFIPSTLPPLESPASVLNPTITAGNNHDDTKVEVGVDHDMNLDFHMFTLKPEEFSSSMIQTSSTSTADPADEVCTDLDQLWNFDATPPEDFLFFEYFRN